MSSYNVHESGSPVYQKSLKDLCKKYPHAQADIEEALKRLNPNPCVPPSKRVPRFPDNHIRYIRAKSTDMQRGTRGGFRLVYLVEKQDIYPLLVYAKTRTEKLPIEDITCSLESLDN